MSKEFKSLVYYYIRRQWYSTVIALCDDLMTKKGKEPTALFWKAFCTGMQGNIMECLRILENFQSRKDLQYPVTLAMLYFHKKSSNVDREAVSSLRSELSVSEDIVKEVGLIMAARFCLFTNNYKDASRISEKLVGSKQMNSTSSPFEIEAATIIQWCTTAEAEMMAGDFDSSTRKQLQAIDDFYTNNKNADSPIVFEVDSLLSWAKVKSIIYRTPDVINVLNQIIAIYPQFVAALGDKALLLASDYDWDQALDTAQRLLDVESDSLDALKIIAVHAFTQESQPHDALQKLEDLDNAIRSKEPNSIDIAVEVASLFSAISARQPRALQICARLLERVVKNAGLVASNQRVSTLYCQLGHIYILQGVMLYEKATKAFREATRLDPENAKALEGMILCQLCEGAIEDAEAQIELLTLMHSVEDLGHEFAYLQSLILKQKKDGKKDHVNSLLKCKDMLLEKMKSPNLGSIKTHLNSFQNLLVCSPDFLMLLAIEFFGHLEANTSISSFIPSSNNSLLSNTSSNGKNNANNSTINDNTTVATTESSYSNNNGVEISVPVKIGIDLIQMVLRSCPGMICAYVELSRCYTAMGMFEDASRTLQQCLTLQPQCSPVLVAMSSVEAGQLNTATADRVLEQALACDFSIRSAPRFRLIKAIIRTQQSRFDEAIAEIEYIMSLPELNFSLPTTKSEQESKKASYNIDTGLNKNTIDKNTIDSTSLQVHSNNSYADSLRLVDDDRVGAFVCYSSLLGRTRRMKEANKVLAHAKVTFSGSPQEVQVLVAASQLYVEKNDFDAAIRMLDKVPQDSPTYSRAQLIKADIILNNNHDKEGFTRCYQQLVDRDPTGKNFALLGEAYLRILNPEAAIDALKQAYKLDPKNSRLRGRIGKALVSTHKYHRAVEFYELSIRELEKAQTSSSSSKQSTSDSSFNSDLVYISHDLAKLYIKLGRSEQAIRVLKNVLHNPPHDIISLRQDVTTLLLIAEVLQPQQYQEQDKSNNSSNDEVIESYEKAFTNQKEIIRKLRSSTSGTASADIIEKEKVILSDIAYQLGNKNKNEKQAEELYQESIQHNPHNSKSMLGLAKIMLNRGEKEPCTNQCKKILTAIPDTEEAAILLSEVLFSTSIDDPMIAVKPLLDLLHMNPNNYNVLEKAITILRRTGQLIQAIPLLTAAKTADRRCISHPGYNYCEGLYARFTNDIVKAILSFNLARKDNKWGESALTHMIELYLNPDQEGVWEEKESGPLDDVTRANISAAEELLRELKPKATDPKRIAVLENYCGLSTRNKANVDRAMKSFIEMLDKDQDYLPAVLGMATGFMIEKNQHKARNLLKRIGKMERNRHDGEDFEKANLLLAKFYIDKGKNDLAQDLCRKTLLENKSCSQAWEILGLIEEKDSKYELAADAYLKAFQLEFEASASVGFKLAFCYLKCKKYVESIDICEIILNQYPDYPRITEEILRKAQEGIRITN